MTEVNSRKFADDARDATAEQKRIREEANAEAKVIYDGAKTVWDGKTTVWDAAKKVYDTFDTSLKAAKKTWDDAKAADNPPGDNAELAKAASDAKKAYEAEEAKKSDADNVKDAAKGIWDAAKVIWDAAVTKETDRKAA